MVQPFYGQSRLSLKAVGTLGRGGARGEQAGDQSAPARVNAQLKVDGATLGAVFP